MTEDANASKVLAIIRSITAGATNDDLLQGAPELSAGIRVECLNKLLKEGTIEIFKKGATLVYRVKDAKRSSAVPTDADTEEKVVFTTIETAGNKGIWIRDIRIQTNLNMTQLNKILKSLETKKLIKAIKSVNASKKKVYMLYNLEPDRSITGGAWYQDQDFESEFVDILNKQCLRFLQMRKEQANKSNEGPLAVKRLSCCSVKEVHKFISDLGISKVSLDEDDLETILKTVAYDEKADRIMMVDGTYAYCALSDPSDTPALVTSPCGICPLIRNCSRYIGEVTLTKCDYMKEWLD